MGKKEASADNDVVVKNFPNQEAFMSALEASIMSDSNEQTTELLFFLTMAICNTVLVSEEL
jgi:hypothetical protein